MDQSLVIAKTFILKTNIHSTGCGKKLKKLLQSINGVHVVSIDAEQGKITVSGTIDPHTLLKLVGKESDFLLEPVIDHKDLQTVPTQKSAANNHLLNHKDVLAQLQKLSEFKGLEYVKITRDAMKLTFKEGNDFSCSNGTSSAINSPCAAAMNEQCHGPRNCDSHVKHEFYCTRNLSMRCMHTHCCINCNGCRLSLPATCRCMASAQGSIPASGIPWPGYNINTPSAPPEYFPPPLVYYPPPPVPPPPVPPPYNDPFNTTFSENNPRSCMVM